MLDDLLAQADYLRPFEMLTRILVRHDGRRKLTARLGAEAEDGIDALLDQALAYEAVEAPSLTGFLDWIDRDEVAVKRRMEEEADQVRVMTVHGAKGLEAPIVILPDTAVRPEGRNPPQIVRLADGQPAWRVKTEEAPPALVDAEKARRALVREENRRLLYVALTRAKSWLVVCGAGQESPNGESWHGLVARGDGRARRRAGARPRRRRPGAHPELERRACRACRRRSAGRRPAAGLVPAPGAGAAAGAAAGDAVRPRRRPRPARRDRPAPSTRRRQRRAAPRSTGSSRCCTAAQPPSARHSRRGCCPGSPTCRNSSPRPRRSSTRPASPRCSGRRASPRSRSPRRCPSSAARGSSAGSTGWSSPPSASSPSTSRATGRCRPRPRRFPRGSCGRWAPTARRSRRSGPVGRVETAILWTRAGRLMALPGPLVAAALARAEGRP